MPKGDNFKRMAAEKKAAAEAVKQEEPKTGVAEIIGEVNGNLANALAGIDLAVDANRATGGSITRLINARKLIQTVVKDIAPLC